MAADKVTSPEEIEAGVGKERARMVGGLEIEEETEKMVVGLEIEEEMEMEMVATEAKEARRIHMEGNNKGERILMS